MGGSGSWGVRGRARQGELGVKRLAVKLMLPQATWVTLHGEGLSSPVPTVGAGVVAEARGGGAGAAARAGTGPRASGHVTPGQAALRPRRSPSSWDTATVTSKRVLGRPSSCDRRPVRSTPAGSASSARASASARWRGRLGASPVGEAACVRRRPTCRHVSGGAAYASAAG